MIDKINVNVNRQTPPAFTGGIDLLIKGIQQCEKYPMLNVSVLDLSTAIVPRTVMETYVGTKKENQKREPNIYSGMEAFRRESSGLIVNCLIPSFVVLGAGKILQKPVMGSFSKSNMAGTWAGGEMLEKIHHYYKNAQGTGNEKTVDAMCKQFLDMEGLDGHRIIKFKEVLDPGVLKEKVGKLLNSPSKATRNGLNDYIVGKTHAAENIRYVGDKKFTSYNLRSYINDGSKVLNNVTKANVAEGQLEKFFKQSKRLVNTKSIAGLVLVGALAVSMQPLNRWITRKTSGKEGFPGYNDFKDKKHKELTQREKAELLGQKFVSIGSMIGVALLSMMKIPNASMFQFKGLFPTMDQARLISTTTFASRMASSEDKIELRESTLRDIATFCSFYFLGDYVAKGIATYMERRNPDRQLINYHESYHKSVKQGANMVEKFWNWAKHTSLKSSDELAHADKRLRTICQLGNMAFSLAALGIFIPYYTRTHTHKKHQEELAMEQMQGAKKNIQEFLNKK